MVQITANPEMLTITLAGRMDTPTCERLETDLLGRIGTAGVPVVFDLQQVNYVCSMFLRLCIRAAQQVGTHNLSIVHVHPEIKKVFKIAGFDQALRIS
jgi:anti-anti-sigma factor